MPHHRPSPSFNQYADEKAGAVIMGAIVVTLLIGIALIITGLMA